MNYGDTAAVVREVRVLDTATRRGWNEFGAGDDPSDEPAGAVDHFTGSARYANHVAPDLRALAGYGDAGHGTYRVERPVVVIPEGDGDDVPATGEILRARDVFDAVHDAWMEGAYDALEGLDAPRHETRIY